MNTQKILRWALPALLMSAMTFELMPGSVRYYAAEAAATPETAYNFFTVDLGIAASSCLPIAGAVTMVTLLLSLVALCLKKKVYRATAWCALAAGVLTAVPYTMASENELLQPNVLVSLLLMLCWGISLYLDKQKIQQTQYQGRRL